MEKYLLTSQNFSSAKCQAKGRLDLFNKISKISSADKVFIEAELPTFEMSLIWKEYSRPLFSYAAFMPLISPKLYSYQFQYFGIFEMNHSEIVFGNSGSKDFGEYFQASLDNHTVFSFEHVQSNQCNLSWLLDFLMNAENISSYPQRDERLIWQQSSKGYELVLESNSIDKKITERQVFSFQNNFESVSWQHQVKIS